MARRPPPQPGGDGVEGPEGARGVGVGVQIDAKRPAFRGVQARVIDLVEEVLQGPGQIAEVDRASEQVSVRGEHLHRSCGQSRPHLQVDALDCRVARPSSTARCKAWVAGDTVWCTTSRVFNPASAYLVSALSAVPAYSSAARQQYHATTER